LPQSALDGDGGNPFAVIDRQPTIEVAIVMSPDASWEKIGQLSRD
jgi:hypothetical protein